METERYRIGVLTCRTKPNITPDDMHLFSQMTSRGHSLYPIVWSDAHAAITATPRIHGNHLTEEISSVLQRLKEIDILIIRSTWDYHEHVDMFLEFIRIIVYEFHIPLLNSLEWVEWNTKKTYLRDLYEMEGISIVPTAWIESSSHASEDVFSLANDLGWIPNDLHIDDRHESNEIASNAEENNRILVVKPFVSASATNTFALNAENCLRCTLPNAFENAWKGTEIWLLQPFAKEIIEFGEVSLYLLGGVFSHACVKRPFDGDFRVQPDFGGMVIPFQEATGTEVPTSLISWASEVVDAARRIVEARVQKNVSLPLYARIDCILCPEPRLMELELVEPCLYLIDGGAPPQSICSFTEVLECTLAERSVDSPPAGLSLASM